MSYNLLLDTNFTHIDKHWKLTNCEYKDGYLIGNSTTYSIEQEIVLPDPTKLYFSIEYICFDSNVQSLYCGIFNENGILEATKKKVNIRKRKKLAVVDQSLTEKVKAMFIIEAKTPNTRIYIDSPLLIDLKYQGKDNWPKWMLKKALDYRYGYEYTNVYPYSEITLNNEDFKSVYTETEQGKIGILAKVIEKDWFKINCKLIQNHIYLIKLDYEQINSYGDMYLSYGEVISEFLDEEQLYVIFKANDKDEIKLHVENKEELPYLINLKHIMILDITNLKIDEDDIPHLPFI